MTDPEQAPKAADTADAQEAYARSLERELSARVAELDQIEDEIAALRREVDVRDEFIDELSQGWPGTEFDQVVVRIVLRSLRILRPRTRIRSIAARGSLARARFGMLRKASADRGVVEASRLVVASILRSRKER